MEHTSRPQPLVIAGFFACLAPTMYSNMYSFGQPGNSCQVALLNIKHGALLVAHSEPPPLRLWFSGASFSTVCEFDGVAKGPTEFFSLIGSPTVGKWWTFKVRTLGAKNEEQLKPPLDTTNSGSGADAASGNSAPTLATEPCSTQGTDQRSHCGRARRIRTADGICHDDRGQSRSAV